MVEAFEPNPRAVIGANNPPPDEAVDPADLLFIDARIVEWTLVYIQDVFEVESLRVSGKARALKKAMGLRRAAVYCLADGLVSQDSLGDILGYHRDTIGDDQASVARWASLDDEFAEWVENLRLAVIGNVNVRIHRDAFVDRMMHWIASDAALKRKKDRRAAAALAAKRKAAADALEAEEKHVAKVKEHAETLRARGYKNASAVEAEHMGPKALARRLTKEALGVVDAVHLAETKITPKKGERLRMSALDEVGLEECQDYGLVRDGEPYLSKARDRYVAPTLMLQSVYFEAIALGRLQKPKRKKEDDDDADEDE